MFMRRFWTGLVTCLDERHAEKARHCLDKRQLSIRQAMWVWDFEPPAY
jgi:hypothetical protein